jgi:hypothetical protein
MGDAVIRTDGLQKTFGHVDALQLDLEVAEGEVLGSLGPNGAVLAWLGATFRDSSVPVRLMLEAGANSVAPALLVLGFGTLVHGCGHARR